MHIAHEGIKAAFCVNRGTKLYENVACAEQPKTHVITMSIRTNHTVLVY